MFFLFLLSGGYFHCQFFVLLFWGFALLVVSNYRFCYWCFVSGLLYCSSTISSNSVVAIDSSLHICSYWSKNLQKEVGSLQFDTNLYIHKQRLGSREAQSRRVKSSVSLLIFLMWLNRSEKRTIRHHLIRLVSQTLSVILDSFAHVYPGYAQACCALNE